MTKAKQLGITDFPYKEFDSNGNLVYREYSSGNWYKYEYDSNCNMIYREYSDGDGCFRYYEGDKLIKEIERGYKEHYISYKRNLLLNTLLND